MLPAKFLKNLIVFPQLLMNVSTTQIHGQKKMRAGGWWEEKEREDSSLLPNTVIWVVTSALGFVLKVYSKNVQNPALFMHKGK